MQRYQQSARDAFGDFADPIPIEHHDLAPLPGDALLMQPVHDRRGYASLRQGRTSMRGWCYLVTTVTIERAPRFAHSPVAEIVARLHEDAALFADANVHAWVLMPDHWHGIVRLGESSSLSAVVSRFKSRTALAANAALGRKGALWFRGFHDRALRNDREYTAATQYILQNPVKAGLCARPGEYPFMGKGADWAIAP